MQQYRLPLAVRRAMLVATIVIILAIIVFVGYFLYTLLFPTVDQGVQLPVTADATLQTFGDKVLSFDGSILECYDAQGGTLWSFPSEVGSRFYASDKNVVVWKGKVITMLDEKGFQVFSKTLEIDTDILDARVSASYAVVQVGSLTNSQIIILNTNAQKIDNVSFPDQRILDFGFFGTVDMYWVMALDTSGRVPITYVTTYQVTKNMTGYFPISDQLVYRALFSQGELTLVGSQDLMVADYAESKILTDRTKLIYGWYLVDSRLTDSGQNMIFAPSPEPGESNEFSDLRVFQGAEEKRIHLLYPVSAALCGESYIFGFKNDRVYVYDYNGKSVDSAPMRFNVDKVIGMVGSSRALVTSGNDVHIIRLR